jgi:hypothetical protein
LRCTLEIIPSGTGVSFYDFSSLAPFIPLPSDAL